MGFNNPPIPWSEFERRLSGRRRPGGPDRDADGGDSPAWSRHRQPVRPRDLALDTGPYVPYAELHAHSDFSFLDGASEPEALLEEAARLRLSALAITDHDGLYGVVRMAEAAEAYGSVATVFGAELSLGLTAPQNGVADPEGSHLLVLARGQAGYHRLAAAITDAQLAPGAEKGRPVYDLGALSDAAGGDWLVLTGCRKGAVRQALAAEGGGTDAAGRELDRLIELFGRQNVLVELFDHGEPLASAYNDALYELAQRRRLPVVATGNVHYATPADRPLATAVAAVRARRSLDELDGWLPAAGAAHLRSGAEMARLFARYPGAVETTVEVASDLAFELRNAKPRLPRLEVPAGHTPMSWLRVLVERGVAERYPEERYPGFLDEVHARMRKELAVIEEKDFPGYFLIVHDIVQEARRRGILCQGRGSAANSAVCYVLGITAVDAIFFNLPFERFLSSLREEEPDIDVDFDSKRREEIIQYVFEKYGRRNAAQVANVISYRPKAAVRDMAKALGHSPGQQDAWTKQVEGWGAHVSSDEGHDIPASVVELAQKLMNAPRHLGIHSGGMVLTERPIGEVCPIEHARMDGRTVLQWDKNDIEWMGLVKFDLLGLGMLEAIQYMLDLVRERVGEEWTLASLPKEEPAVYDMLCRADAIGVFQVESRAQLGTLPRLKPRRFYDLVIEVALIRPGPIQGGAVHPYLRRRTGAEPVSYLHPKLEPVLRRTLGIPLFQEQIMQMAMAVGGCTAADADQLRRAMGSKRGVEKIDSLREKLFAGMAANGITGDDAVGIYEKIEAFAGFGFAESHSLSFALLVYASSWLKLHYPAAFLAGLLRAQPMGFYSAQTLTGDAVRHGVEVLNVDLVRSGVHADLEATDAAGVGQTGRESCLHWQATGSGDPDVLDEAPPFDPEAPDESAAHRRDGRFAVRLGLAEVNGIGEAVAERIVAERSAAPFTDLHDLARRVGLSAGQLEALAAAGAFESLGLTRREALWQAGSAARERRDYLPGTAVVVQPPLLPMLTPAEQVVYDLWATGVAPGDHPIRHVRERLQAAGVLSAVDLDTHETGRRVLIGGVVTHRQRPATAAGVTFLNLEDETGLVNVIVSVGVWQKYRRVAREAPAMIIRGILERSPEGVVSVVADRLDRLPLAAKTKSRDFG
ncbi:error-prone DNA polymerase [Gryllotalpicola ginsengisoli]|uniref:error-prone DNA polymerase n=1 Tax=Gryllotalpicola ginsengisoli TaxID=444608 RepID=UPI0003B73F9A|nr:error-prone DNA polymerase [Gryllotalpicola ginsengisoli]